MNIWRKLKQLKSSDVKIVMDDFNAKLENRIENIIGPHGPGKLNERGEQLAEWCAVNEFTATIHVVRTAQNESRHG